MAEHLILLTGGVRSGKSRKALALAEPYPEKLFVATATPGDDEMRERIVRHQEERGAGWHTHEEPLDLAAAMRERPEAVAVVDCITLWLANAMFAKVPIESALDDFLTAAASRKAPVIIVTNEVGWGVVPAYETGRQFRDLAGITNQRLAAAADAVYLIVSGLELRLK